MNTLQLLQTETERPESIAAAHVLLDRARAEGGEYFPSPADWRDEVLYFLLPDRFSDGREGGRPLLTREEIRSLRDPRRSRPDVNWRDWASSGLRWQGGTLPGIRQQLDYLHELGVTALWIGPVFKQRARLDTYHGYGVQDFLDVDPRFGSRRDLVELVGAAHERRMRIILDVIINHSGNNWGYAANPSDPSKAMDEPPYRPFPDFYGNPSNPETREYRIAWRNEQEVGFTVRASDLSRPHDGVWPRELQDSVLYTRAGRGSLSESDVRNPHAEHKRTDFLSLRDFALDAPRAVSLLADCFKYWIALSDCDGFRIDTVKHVSLDEVRSFCGAIREFADSLGKRRFLLLGEIAGGDEFQDFVFDNLAVLQRNLNAALDIGSARGTLHRAAKGLAPSATYLDGFKEGADGFESHRSFGDRHVSILDDHDHVMGEKLRFSAGIPDESDAKDYQCVVGTAFQLFTLGIPCIYYGTEQAFAGPAQSQLSYLLDEGWGTSDRFLREAMFGPEHPRAHHDSPLDVQLVQQDKNLPGFGAFGTSGKHCFDRSSPAYVRIAALCRARAAHPVLRIGRQYPRQIRNGVRGPQFEFPNAGELVAWSRILDRQEAVCAVNTNGQNGELRGGDVIVSAELWSPGTEFTVVANSAEAAAKAQGKAFLGTHSVGSKLQVQGRSAANEPAYLEVRGVPPAEVIVLVKQF